MAESTVGSSSRPLRVAIIGSGPSAFYAAEALFKVEGLTVRCDMFDRLPTPFGLVRGGVAPDHQKIKNVVRVYEKTASHEGFRFFGNVKLGRDIQVDDLTANYDQIIYAVGNESSRDLGIDGEETEGCVSATEFVFWYNGHPDYKHLKFDLENATRVAVVGNGNVAMDVCRVLIQPPDRLAETDIADYALEALRTSKVREVLLLGRRGPAQAAFSPKEIQEIAEIDGVDVVVDPDSVVVDPVTQKWLDSGDAPKSAKRNLDILTELSTQGAGSAGRKVHCHSLVSPVEVLGDGAKVSAVRLQRNELYEAKDGTPRPRPVDSYLEEPVQLIFKAIGYRGIEIPGVPFHRTWGTIPNVEGRVTKSEDDNTVVPGQYVVGWAKRGPSGLIGTNSPDSKKTVEKMMEDLAGRKAEELVADESESIVSLLRDRGIRFFTYDDWKTLDELEQSRGASSGRVRQKFTGIDEMISAVQGA